MAEAIAKTRNRTFSVPERVGPTSLNSVRRKHDIRDISNSNIRLSNRLESVKSEYSVSNMKKCFEQNQRYALNSSFSLRKHCEEVVRELNSQFNVE